MAARADLRWMRALAVLLLCLSAALPGASETSRTYYDTLDVEPTATDSQIKRAFRKLAVKYHPDKNKSSDAERTFREIAEAYTVLSDKEKRRLYDSVDHDTFLTNEASVHPEDEDEDEDEMSFHFSFADVFHDFEDSFFTEESHFHWSFKQDGDDEDALYERYSFEESGFNLYFGNEDENEEEYHY